jgi:Zn-dependent protease/CBS domain-containing protein
MRTLYHIATWRGTPLRLHYTLFSAALLGAALLIGYTLPAALPELGGLGRFALALFIVALSLLVIVAHEAAHLFVARAMGVIVPVVNLYPLGALTRLPDRRASPKAAFWVAAAGPAASLALWLVLTLATASVALPAWLAVTLGIVARVSLVLGLINLLPGLPFDGGRMLRAALWLLSGTFESASTLASRLGQALSYGLILVGAGLVVWRQDWVLGGILLLIGWGALDASGALHRRAVVAQLLHKLSAADVLRPPGATLPPTTSLRDAWLALRSQAHGAAIPVVDAEQFLGMISNEQLLAVPQGYWDTRTVAEVLTPATALGPVSPDTPLSLLLPRLTDSDAFATASVPVVEDGRLLGQVEAREMTEFLELDDTFGLLPRPGAADLAATEAASSPPAQPQTRQPSPASGGASRP